MADDGPRPPHPKRLPGEDEAAFEARMRAHGLRKVVFWLPDTSTPEFAERARRESLAVANSPHAKEDQEFVDSISAPLEPE